MSWFKTVRYEFCLCNGQGPIFQSENVQNFQLEASNRPHFKPEVEPDSHSEVLPDKILLKKPQFKPEIDPDLTKHVAYADDLAGGSKLEKLRNWWDRTVQYGPAFGYYPKPSKSWLVVKESEFDRASTSPRTHT